MKKIAAFVGICLISAAVVMTITSWAASGVGVSFTGASTDTGVCISSTLEVAVNYTTDTDDGGNVDQVGLIFFDGNNQPLNAQLFGGSAVPSGSVSTTVSLSLGSAGLNDITAQPVLAALYDVTAVYAGAPSVAAFYNHIIANNTGLPLSTSSIDPIPLIASCAILIPPPPPPPPPSASSSAPVAASAVVPPPNLSDGRLCDWGTNGAVYASSDGIYVYGIDAQGVGYLTTFISAGDIALSPGQPPVNTLLASSGDGRFRIYRLTTGEFQVNAGPDFEGKERVVIFTGLPPSAVACSEFR